MTTTLQILEEAFLETMEALAELHSAMNTVHQIYAKNLRQNGDRRATSQANLILQSDLQRLIAAGNYSSLQCRGMTAAVGAWRPTVPDNRIRSLPFTGRSGGAA